jgi:hypothetical protein
MEIRFVVILDGCFRLAEGRGLLYDRPQVLQFISLQTH